MNLSFVAHIFNAILFLIPLYLFIKNYEQIDIGTAILILTLLSIAVGLFAILQYVDDKINSFNPLEKLSELIN